MMNPPRLIITLDYELPAGGAGDVRRDMILPTRGMLDACEVHGAALTLMVELGELWAFAHPANAHYSAELGYSPASEIQEQLIQAIRRGHDVQLHLHPQWLGARWENGQWSLDYTHYRLSDLTRAEAIAVLRRGREELDTLLVPHAADYACVAFRAGYWNTSPAAIYLDLLQVAGLHADTSIFKGGLIHRRSVDFDYRTAHHPFRAWRVCPADINRADSAGLIVEVPIATREAGLFEMLSFKRLLLARRYLREDREIESRVGAASADNTVPSASILTRMHRLAGRHPMKLDFCKLSARQMMRITEDFVTECEREGPSEPVPLVAIGHSKQAGGASTLDAFLRQARQRLGSRLAFSTLRHFIRDFHKEVPGNGSAHCD